jgi:hypothetical protein
MYLAGLLATWDARDGWYLRRTRKDGEKRVPYPLSPAERQAVLAWRRQEAMKLDQPERGLALAALREWRP